MAGGDPLSGSSDSRGQVDEPAGPLAGGGPAANLQSIGRLINEASQDLRDGKTDPQLLKSLGMSQQQFAAFVEKYSQRIGRIEKMKETTAGPDGAIRGDFAIPGSDRLRQGAGLDSKLDNVRGGEKLTPDQIRKLHEQRAAKVAPEYRKHVEAYFRAVSEQKPEEKTEDSTRSSRSSRRGVH